MKRKMILPLTILAAALIILGCAVSNLSVETANVGELQNESQTVDLGDANAVRVDIKMGVGELKIDSGAEALMEGDFTYNVAAWQPEVNYDVQDDHGRLTIRQPNTSQLSLRGDVRYKWDLAFNNAVPLDMRIECGTGNGDIDLGELNVTRVDVKLGAGNFTVDLKGNESLRRLEFDVGTGDVTLDLDGNWKEDVDVNVQGGVGKTTLRLPKDIGVRVNVAQAIGDVNTSGLTNNGNGYTNAAYGNADVTLEINIQAGVGQINLEVVE